MRVVVLIFTTRAPSTSPSVPMYCHITSSPRLPWPAPAPHYPEFHMRVPTAEDTEVKTAYSSASFASSTVAKPAAPYHSDPTTFYSCLYSHDFSSHTLARCQRQLGVRNFTRGFGSA